MTTASSVESIEMLLGSCKPISNTPNESSAEAVAISLLVGLSRNGITPGHASVLPVHAENALEATAREIPWSAFTGDDQKPYKSCKRIGGSLLTSIPVSLFLLPPVRR